MSNKKLVIDHTKFLKLKQNKDSNKKNRLYNLDFLISIEEKNFKVKCPSQSEINCYLDMVVNRYDLRRQLELLDVNKYKKFLYGVRVRKEEDAKKRCKLKTEKKGIYYVK